MTPSRGSCWTHLWSVKSVENSWNLSNMLVFVTVVPAEQAQGKLKIGVNR